MRLTINASNKYIFDCIKEGSKKVETRAATPRYKKLKEGEEITFSCSGELVCKTISKLIHFDSIESLLKNYNPRAINPKCGTKEEITAMYHSFPGYEEKIKASGIIAIELE